METEQDWTVWCKSKPKEPKEVSQTFRAFDRCIFTGQKNAKSSKKGKRHQGNDGGKHVLRKRGRVVETRRYLNMPSYRKHGLLDAPRNTDANQGVEALKNAWQHESKKDELRVDLQGLEKDFWLGSVTMLMAPQSITQTLTAHPSASGGWGGHWPIRKTAGYRERQGGAGASYKHHLPM